MMSEQPRAARRPHSYLLYLPVRDDAPAGVEDGPTAPRLRYLPLTVAQAAALDAALLEVATAPDAASRGAALDAATSLYAAQIVGVEGDLSLYAGDGVALARAVDGVAIWRALDNRDGAAFVKALQGRLSVSEGN
jgi:hypothetical protein